ncbi:MAG: zinc-binding dehydrogenase [Pseudobacter sp.]|uniref:zinc-binding dehydrogenase n=1 Tax=Pseudobacter sp. TaxID=2045420 RepID=UPI003F7FEBA5
MHAASGGVGHIAVQLARYLGAEVTGTSSAVNRDFVLSLGADKHIDYKDYNWAGQQKEYDFVLDTVGGNNIDNSIAVTKTGGTIISIPTGISNEASSKFKQAGVNGYFILVKSSGGDLSHIANLIEQQSIIPFVSQTYSFEEIAKAHTQIEAAKTVGKIVVTL